MEAAAFILTLALAVALLLWLAGGRSRGGAVAALAVAAAGLAGAAWWNRTTLEAQRAAQAVARTRPIQVRDAEFVSSKACRACHPGEYASWHRTYHRSMTQAATPQSVLGRFDGERIEVEGVSYEFSREGDAFWVERVTPAGAGGPRRERLRVVMTTGSHHYQIYWVSTGAGRTLDNLPVSFLLDEQRWVPRTATFLMPPGQPIDVRHWNTNCIQCHATQGQPRPQAEGAFDTRAAELGIGCESCHGPGRKHVEARRDPLSRYREHLGEGGDPTIVQPRRLPPPRAAEVCGQCHSSFVARYDAAWGRHGFEYRAGDSLESSRLTLQPAVHLGGPSPPQLPNALEWLERNPGWIEKRFWPDGQSRVTGREYNALSSSACFRGGQLSCLDCHSLHASDPDDMLKQEALGDEVCASCHPAQGEKVRQHTHHRAGSVGAVCVNCHMPYTTYGLLKAVRSHNINSPDVASRLAAGRPNACNLCHLDQTLGWVQDHLVDWYGQEAVPLDDAEQNIADSVLLLLSGDAAQRALIAWHMGWEPAQRASGSGWLPPYLARTLADPYDAVRYVGYRSLRSLPGQADLEYDYVGPQEQRVAAAAGVVSAWERTAEAGLDPAHRTPQLLIDPAGHLDHAQVWQLWAERDRRKVMLEE